MIKKISALIMVALLLVGTMLVSTGCDKDMNTLKMIVFNQNKSPEGTYVCSGEDNKNISFSTTYIFNSDGTGTRRHMSQLYYSEAVADFLWRQEDSRIYLHKASLETEPVEELVYDKDSDRLISTTGDKIYVKQD